MPPWHLHATIKMTGNKKGTMDRQLRLSPNTPHVRRVAPKPADGRKKGVRSEEQKRVLLVVCILTLLLRSRVYSDVLQKAAKEAGFKSHNAAKRVRDFIQKNESTAQRPRTVNKRKYKPDVMDEAMKRIAAGARDYTGNELMAELQADGLLPENCYKPGFLFALRNHAHCLGKHLSTNCTHTEVWQAKNDANLRESWCSDVWEKLATGKLKLENIAFVDEVSWQHHHHPKGASARLPASNKSVSYYIKMHILLTCTMLCSCLHLCRFRCYQAPCSTANKRPHAQAIGPASY